MENALTIFDFPAYLASLSWGIFTAPWGIGEASRPCTTRVPKT